MASPKSLKLNSGISNHGIKNFDILGAPFKLKFSSLSGNFQTRIGGCLSIAISIAIVGLFLIITSQYFDTTDPVVTTSTEFKSEIFKFNLYEQDLLFPVALVVAGQLLFGDQHRRFATIKAQIHEYHYNNQTNNYVLNVLHDFDYIPCNRINDTAILKLIAQVNSLSAQMNDAALCPDFRGIPNEYQSFDNPFNSSYKVAVMKVYPCSLPDPRMCASELEVKYTQLMHARMEKLLVSSDKKNPVNLKPRIMADVVLDNYQVKSHTYSVKDNKIIDDTSYWKKPTTSKEYATYELDSLDSRYRDPAQLHCAQTGVKNQPFVNCFEYFSASFPATGNVQIIRRNYRKITTVLGEFGGSVKLLTSSAFIVYAFYNLWLMRTFLVGVLYDSGAAERDSASKLLKEKAKRDKEEGRGLPTKKSNLTKNKQKN